MLNITSSDEARLYYERRRSAVLCHSWGEPFHYRAAVVALGQALQAYARPEEATRWLNLVGAALSADGARGRRRRAS
jgi:hypothetical protein